MHIFIAARVPRADRSQQALCAGAARAVQGSGHTPFLAYQEILAHGLKEPQRFMPFVRAALRGCDGLLLLYHLDLRGGLIEAGMAYAWEKPVWLAHDGRSHVSSSALGMAQAVLVYRDAADLEHQIMEHLRLVSP